MTQPTEPTEGMIAAGIEAIRVFGGTDTSPPSDEQCRHYVTLVWDAMMSANCHCLVPTPSWDVIYELRQGLSAYMSEFFCSGDDQTDNDAAGAWLDQVEAAMPPCEEQHG